MENSTQTPEHIKQKYIELIEKSNVQYHKKRNLFHVRNIFFYLLFIAIVLALSFYIRSEILSRRNLFENNLEETSFADDKILIQTPNGKLYEIDKNLSTEWLSEAGVLIQIKPQSIKFISAGNIDLNKHNNAYTIFVSETTPYNLTLLDGSNIKINKGTSVHFNLQPDIDDMNVEINGEAYFDITHQEEGTFKIKSKELFVEVFGTEFNIKNTTSSNEIVLVNGFVKVSTQNQTVNMIQGEQVKYNIKTQKLEKNNADFLEALQWNSTYYHFSNEKLIDITLKIGAWYHVRFEFQTPELKKLSFTGKLKIDDGLVRFLEMLKYTDGINSKIENDKIFLYK